MTPAVAAIVTASPPRHPGDTEDYKLYPGGQTYDVTPIARPAGRLRTRRAIDRGHLSHHWYH